jgi:type II secretory ATPase GspE/PulE/Tfp pilus assembly ATPase PilB-like protein
MNPFLTPKKRGISWPSGCKDLADVLRLPVPQSGDPVQTFIRMVLLRAESVRASEVIIGAAMVHDGECSVTQRIAYELHHVSTIPADFRSSMVTELLRMADLSDVHFPAHGLATLQLKRRQLKWKLQIESAEADCQLTPFDQ